MSEDPTHVTQRNRVLAGRYALLEELGRGGMGVVWRATDQVIGRPVAIKELRLPDGGEGAEVFQERVMREVRTGGRLNDPAVVTVYDVVNQGESTFIVMELVDAPTLSDLVRERGPLSTEVAAAIGEQVLSALTAAHQAGIVHRDVKPGNIMVAPNGRVKLTDFGIAQAMDDPRLTTSGFLVGSPAFMAPERIAGNEAVPASDIWSLGVTLYFAVEGTIAFDRGTTAATLHSIMNEVPYLTRTKGPLASAIMAMLITAPEARITAAQAQELLAMARTATGAPLAPAGQQTSVYPGQTPTVIGTGPHRAPAPGMSAGKKKAALIGGALVALLLLVGGMLIGNWWGSPPAGERAETLSYGAEGDITDFKTSSGQCVNEELRAGRAISGNTVQCEEAHYFQVFATVDAVRDNSNEPIDYPGERLRAVAESQCDLHFHSNLVDDTERAKRRYSVLIPTQQAWETDSQLGGPARKVYCVAIPPDDGQVSGTVLVEDT